MSVSNGLDEHISDGMLRICRVREELLAAVPAVVRDAAMAQGAAMGTAVRYRYVAWGFGAATCAVTTSSVTTGTAVSAAGRDATASAITAQDAATADCCECSDHVLQAAL